MIIAVDLDLTLTKEDYVSRFFPKISYDEAAEFYLRVPVKKDVARKVREWKQKGHSIVIFTSRGDFYLDVTERWLKKHKIPYDRIVMGKPHYDLFLDDKAESSVEQIEERLK